MAAISTVIVSRTRRTSSAEPTVESQGSYFAATVKP